MPYFPPNPAFQNIVPNTMPPGTMSPQGMYPGNQPMGGQMPMGQMPMGGANPGMNHFNPYGGNGSYSSQQGLLGGGNPMGGGNQFNGLAGNNRFNGLMGSGNPNGGSNHFDPYGGNGAYSSGAGLLGGGNPNGGGNYGGSNPFGGGGNSFGSFLSSLGGLFGGGDWTNPADAANKYLDKIPGTIKPYYDPYINAGRSALDSLMGQYGGLVNDPGAILSKLGGGFQKSPGYQFQVDQATDAANRAGAASGMLGSPAEQQQVAGAVNGLANQDYYNYLNHAENLYGTGLQGLSGINSMGYNASTSLADMLANIMGQQAQYGAQGQDLQNQRNSAQQAQFWNSLGNMGQYAMFGGY